MGRVHPAIMNRADRYMNQFQDNFADVSKSFIGNRLWTVYRTMRARGRFPREMISPFLQNFEDALRKETPCSHQIFKDIARRSASKNYPGIKASYCTWINNITYKSDRKYEERTANLTFHSFAFESGLVRWLSFPPQIMIGHHAIGRFMEREISSEPLHTLLEQFESLKPYLMFWIFMSRHIGDEFNHPFIIPFGDHVILGKTELTGCPLDMFEFAMNFTKDDAKPDTTIMDDWYMQVDKKAGVALVPSLRVLTAVDYDATGVIQDAARNIVRDHVEKNRAFYIQFFHSFCNPYGLRGEETRYDPIEQIAEQLKKVLDDGRKEVFENPIWIKYLERNKVDSSVLIAHK